MGIHAFIRGLQRREDRAHRLVIVVRGAQHGATHAAKRRGSGCALGGVVFATDGREVAGRALIGVGRSVE